ncbi:hypothetical protein MG293_016071 [Ovis ammon polii]|uniref:Uncharacterized protein n=1 Tax=Ovis ammon polii TaxID=230172 RepID=A0AAD4Y3L2_OVIAM|nr:hypothetical protein MG293_016071 [Ovis ammon polii]
MRKRPGPMGHLFTERKGILHGPHGTDFWALGTEIQRQTRVIPSDHGLSFWRMDAVRFLRCLKFPLTRFLTNTWTSSVKFCPFLKSQLKHWLLGDQGRIPSGKRKIDDAFIGRWRNNTGSL